MKSSGLRSFSATMGNMRDGVSDAVRQGKFVNRRLRSAAHIDLVAGFGHGQAQPAVGHGARPCSLPLAISMTLMLGGL